MSRLWVPILLILVCLGTAWSALGPGVSGPLTVIPNAITVTGMVESTSGGFKFPDGSVQTTAATGGGGGGAPTGASYVVLGLDPTLTAERVLTGTANQITVTDGGANGNVTLSLPQDIATTSSPTFAGLTLSGLTSGSVLFANAGKAISQDNANLFWDNTNKRLGIGTTTPTAKLDVVGGLIRGDSGLTISAGTVSLPAGQIDNAELANSSITVVAGTGLVTGGTVSLGGTVTIDIGTLTGLTAGADSLAVVYGSTANTAVQGNVTVTCPSGTGNLTGGGTVITLGAGGTCASLNTVANPAFSTSVTTPLITNAGTLTLRTTVTAGADDLILSTAGTERMRILENGNVGIGTAAPGARLQVGNAASGDAYFQFGQPFIRHFFQTEANPRAEFNRDLVGTGLPGWGFGPGGGTTIAAGGSAIGHPASRALGLYTSNGTSLVERVRIDGNGNVGVGTTTPSQRLHVAGKLQVGNDAVAATAGTIRWTGTNFEGFDGSVWKALDVQATSGGGWTEDVAGNRVYVTNTGRNVGIGTTTPGAKLDVVGGLRLTGIHFQNDAGLAAMKVAIPANSQFVLMDAITDTPRIHPVYAGSWAPTLTVQEAINGVRGFGSLFMPDDGDLYLASGRGITFRTNASDVSEANSATDVMTLTTAGNVGVGNPSPNHLIDANLGTLTAQKAGLNIVGTWNNSTAQFAALTMNITDSASTTCSMLMDLQVGGSSKFRVHKTGRLIQAKDVSAVVSPGAGYGLLRWEAGTNPGTLKLVAYSGTSTTGVVIVDNVGGGN